MADNKEYIHWTAGYLDLGYSIDKDKDEIIKQEVQDYSKSLNENSEIADIKTVKGLKKTANQLIIECDNWVNNFKIIIKNLDSFITHNNITQNLTSSQNVSVNDLSLYNDQKQILEMQKFLKIYEAQLKKGLILLKKINKIFILKGKNDILYNILVESIYRNRKASTHTEIRVSLEQLMDSITVDIKKIEGGINNVMDLISNSRLQLRKERVSNMIKNNNIESIAVDPEEVRYRAWSYNFINTIYKKTGGAGVQGRSLEVEYWNIDKNEKSLRELYELFNRNLSKKKQEKILKNIMISKKEGSSQIESIILNNVDGLSKKDQKVLKRGEKSLSKIFDTLKEYQRDSNSQITNKGDISLKTQNGRLYLELKNITAGGAGVSAAQTIVVNIYTISKNLKELVNNGINREIVKQIKNNSERIVFKRSGEKYSDILNEICQDAINNALF